MNSKRTAQNYAAALFALAKEQKKESAVYNDISIAASAVDAEKRLIILLESPAVPMQEKKKFVADVMKGELLSRNFFDLLTQGKAFRYIGAMADAYKKIMDDDQKCEPVKITSAVELEKSQREAVAAKLGGVLGTSVVPEFNVDPNIISGLVIRYKDRIIDASLKTQLQSIASRLI